MAITAAVVGGGISGLALAYRLKKIGCVVTLFESNSTTGGKIGTINRDGWELDLGPLTIAETPEVRQLASELDVRIVEASKATSLRYIFSKGKLHRVGPMIFASSLLSPRGKLSLLKAPFQSKAKSEETVADYARRRFGEEAYQRLFNPMMNGIYAGNSELLGATSVIKKRKRRKIISFEGGVAALTKALADNLGDSIQLNTTIGDVNELKAFDEVHLTAPAFVTEKIIRTPFNIHYSSLSQIYLEVTPGETKFEGFGFLVPSEERMSLLGAVCISNIFPSKTHEGRMLFVLFCGGDRPYAFNWSNEGAVKDFNNIIQPAITKVLHVQEWKNAIPQFYVGHHQIIDRISKFEKAHPRIKIKGNYITGVAVGDCL